MSKNTTKRSLLASVFALVLCVAMLVGSTFAWFTDTATTGVNKIVSGKLDVKLSYLNDKEWKEVSKDTNLFDDNALWEPGHTEVAYLKVENAGNLALKYKLSVNVANEVSGVNVNGEEFNLSEYIKMGVVDGLNGQENAYADRNAARTAVEATAGNIATYTKTGNIAAEGDAQYVALVVYMPETVGNDANYSTKAPSIDLGVTLYATQDTVESDSFNNQYDKDAKYTEVLATGKDFTGKATLSTGITVTNPNAIAVKAIGSDADVTITDGTFDGGKGGDNQCVHVREGAKMTIKGGTFTVGSDANGYGNSVIESYGGNIVIEGGFFYTNYSYNGKYYVLNQNNGNPGTITVKGGTFVNYDPSTGDDHLHGSFVPAGYSVVSSKQANGDVWYTVVSDTSHEGLQEALTNGGELTVSSEIKTNNIADTADARLIISKPTTLNLNAKIVTPDGMTYNRTNFCALIVDADTTINAGENGGIDTGKDGAYGINVRKGATLTINGGHYYGGGTAVQVQQGTLVINGGTFAVEPFGDPYGYNFLLNCIDSAFKDGSAKIIVKGGTFVNFDPSNNTAEGAGTNFVADGYTVQKTTQTNGDIWYKVVAE